MRQISKNTQHPSEAEEGRRNFLLDTEYETFILWDFRAGAVATLCSLFDDGDRNRNTRKGENNEIASGLVMLVTWC
ncbi:hypothetical protein L6164_014904 [Bauhinia variegata]|uniref:Uncharacterized protein n=1 Tax=Bauhinia variegata TaxID=167791 RepID=A0ACB9NKH7_BAUVA|nr:hypothetical protein L6164_014904 [Bauhinia variegata]